MAKKRFSFEDDPGWGEHSESWWKEWRKNMKKAQEADRVCDDCLLQDDAGACIDHSEEEQTRFLSEGKCPDRLV